MIRRTEKRRLSAESGFWKTIWSACTCFRSRLARSWPRAAGRRARSSSPGRALSAREARGPASSCRFRLANQAECLTRLDGRGLMSTTAATCCPSCRKVLFTCSSRTAGPLPASGAVFDCAAPARSGVARAIAAASSWKWQRLEWPPPSAWKAAARPCGRCPRASVQRSAKTHPGVGARAGQVARDRVEAVAILAQAAARDAPQQPDRVRVARVVEDRPASGPPRRAGRRRARRRGRTSS